jgi:hypothetical protein
MLFHRFSYLISSYICEIWFLNPRDECRLRAFENRMLGRIFESGKQVIMQQQRKLHNKDFHNSYSSYNTVNVISSRWMDWESVKSTEKTILSLFRLFDKMFMEENRIG